MYNDQNDMKRNRNVFLNISIVISFIFLILILVEARKYLPTWEIIWKPSEVKQARLKEQNDEANKKTLKEVRCQGLYHPSGTEFILEQGYLALIMTNEQQLVFFNPYQVNTLNISGFKSCLTVKVETNDFKTAKKFRETIGMEIVKDKDYRIGWNNSGKTVLLLTNGGKFIPIINQGRIPIEEDGITNSKVLVFPGMRF